MENTIPPAPSAPLALALRFAQLDDTEPLGIFKILDIIPNPHIPSRYTLVYNDSTDVMCDIRDEPIYTQHPIRVIFTNISNTKRAYIWNTPYSIYHMESESWIPVIDILAPYYTPGKYTHAILDDTVTEQTDRIEKMQSVRFKMIETIYSMADAPLEPIEIEPPRPYIISRTIPKFVAELLIKDAIQKDDICPISMMVFTECESLTVTACYHIFDTASIELWLSSKPECPVCKQIVQ